MKSCVIETIIPAQVITKSGYLLELEKNEVRLLIDLLGALGGTPSNSVRRYGDSILAKIALNSDFVENGAIKYMTPTDKRFKRLEITAAEDSEYSDNPKKGY